LWRISVGERLGRTAHDFVMMVAAHNPTPMPKSTIGQWDMLPVTTVMQKAAPTIAVTSPNKPRGRLCMNTCSEVGKGILSNRLRLNPVDREVRLRYGEEAVLGVQMPCAKGWAVQVRGGSRWNSAHAA